VSLQNALLGLISSMGPVSGYDLTKTFRLSMAHYWHASHGQIYPLLEKLRRDGLIVCQHVRQQDRPNKKLYSITPKGRDSLLRWLRAPRAPIQMKNEGLLKTRFFANLPPEEAIEQVRSERASYEVLLGKYRDLERAFFAVPPREMEDDALYTYFTLKRGIMFLRDSIDWCDWAIRSLQQRRRRNGRQSAAGSRQSPPPAGKS